MGFAASLGLCNTYRTFETHVPAQAFLLGPCTGGLFWPQQQSVC